MHTFCNYRAMPHHWLSENEQCIFAYPHSLKHHSLDPPVFPLLLLILTPDELSFQRLHPIQLYLHIWWINSTNYYYYAVMDTYGVYIIHTAVVYYHQLSGCIKEERS